VQCGVRHVQCGVRHVQCGDCFWTIEI
jgi:hypothetical protein